jgi:hypothetical protein
MDMEKAKDLGATTIGGGVGLEQIYEAVDALMVDGATGQEWLALGKGILLVVFGFMSWRRAS